MLGYVAVGVVGILVYLDRRAIKARAARLEDALLNGAKNRAAAVIAALRARENTVRQNIAADVTRILGEARTSADDAGKVVLDKVEADLKKAI